MRAHDAYSFLIGTNNTKLRGMRITNSNNILSKLRVTLFCVISSRITVGGLCEKCSRLAQQVVEEANCKFLEHFSQLK